MTAKTWFPLVVVGLAGLLLAVQAAPPSAPSEEMDVHAFGQIPVQYMGRFMPIDTVARHHLLLISGGRTTYAVDKEGRNTESAARWLLEVMSGTDASVGFRVIRVDDPDVRQFLGLEKRPGSWRYSAAEVSEKLARKGEDVRKIAAKAAKDSDALTDFEKSLMSTSGHVRTIITLRQLGIPNMFPNPDNPHVWLSAREVDEMNAEQFRARAAREADRRVNDRMLEDPARTERERQKMGPEAFDAMVQEIKDEAAAKRLVELLAENRKDFAPQSAAFHRVLDAYRNHRTDEFNAAVKEYHDKYVAPTKDNEVAKTGLEYFLNRTEPFFVCRWLYILVMALAALSWLTWSRPLNNAATALGFLAVAVHTTALILRIVISGKPPVTNLYSSAVFIGWGGLLLCLGLDLYYRNGLGNFAGGLIGMGTMLIAQFLESNGDTMPRVEAVLNTNFWLATHVTLVTLGYTATFVAGLLGIIYIVSGMFTRSLSADRGRGMYGMVYGVTCFATLLSFVGTVLGGFWADDSWGRFWGWDPKENGAVLIVIWNALNLHLRWGGLVKGRGFAVMAVLGNIVTAWSWFGTNQLGIGLHAYGFDDKLATGCALFWLSQLLIAGLGLVPLKYWASFDPNIPAKAKKAG
jgi:ABC-type transport system involved in cytochrome c biogenesis permease subunit